jgi:hypothetical protein
MEILSVTVRLIQAPDKYPRLEIVKRLRGTPVAEDAWTGQTASYCQQLLGIVSDSRNVQYLMVK